jgi:pteridine reductase
MHLPGSNAIVTGAAVRVGRAIAVALAESGVNVCVHYGTSDDAAAAAVAEVESHGVRGTRVRADLRDSIAAAETIVNHARQVLGPVAILVNSASIFEPGTLVGTHEEHFDRHFAVNLKAPFFLAQAFARQVPKGGEGETTAAIVNVVDWRALRPPPGHLAYTMTKAALAALTRMLAVELAPRLRVNGIAPGPILPPPGRDREPWATDKAAEVPLARVGSPSDVADAALYLLRSEFVTGEILHVTGGEQL